MIIRIQSNGGSFRGAGLYYLHDKSADATIDKHLKPKSDERVWFTDTRNCLSMDAGRAFEEMWLTAEDQAYLKLHAGVKRGGRVCEDPVKTLSVSWHKDDQPTPEHMVEAADALMKHMGWNAHQAVYVGHNDTEHCHIHIILNRVNPDTGRTLDDFREQKRAQSWALEYERSQDQVRCEQREINAAREAGRGEHRQHEPAQTNEAVHGNTRDVTVDHAPVEVSAPVHPANDHLPHNVIMLARPHEHGFAADERHRQAHDVRAHAVEASEQKAELKDRQRAEREAFFKDGAKLFKATRHAAYDEVRREYKAEWRQFYKDSEAAHKSAEASAATAIGRAMYFGRDGDWTAARDAFNDRDSVRNAVEADLAVRKSDLKSRQTEDLRERQQDACDALRDIRDVQYQELLQRQRDERAALQAGQTMETLGVGHPVDVASIPPPEQVANENLRGAPAPDQQPSSDQRMEQVPATAPTSERETVAESEPRHRSREQLILSEAGGSVDVQRIENTEPGMIAPVRGASDLVAGGIGGVASYLADQLGELFAPTPPEIREAQAKANAKQASEREVQKPEVDNKAAAYAHIIDSAVRLAEAERAQKDDAYWKERDRDKGWERDR